MSTYAPSEYLSEVVAEGPRVPEYIAELRPYVPGKAIATVAREFGLEEGKIVKLASNENPIGMSPMAKQAIRQTIDNDQNIYPDPDCVLLKETLSERYQVCPDWITIGNGSSEILELAARILLDRGDSAIYSQYSFASYALVTQGVGGRGICVPAQEYGHGLEAMLESIEPDTKLIFLANPNNPTGTFLSGDKLYAFLQRVPSNIVVLLDEAYTEYLAECDRYDSILWTREFPNLIVARTFSKAYGLAGLRVGYAICQPQLAGMLNRLRSPFNVTAVSQAAAAASVKDSEFLARVSELNARGRMQFYQGFQDLGLRYLPSRANFVLVQVGDAARLNRRLLEHGIIVRPVQNYGLPSWLRISTGMEEQNSYFLKALSEIL